MGMRTLRRKKRLMTLQLTSLLDMFTIILVFLLESFQAEDEDFVMHAGLELPASSARSPFKGAVNIAITTGEVLVEGASVLTLADGAATAEALAAGQVAVITDAVKAAWDSKPRDSEELVATIQADQALPYETIDLVMRSAGFAGCFRFRLVIAKE